MGYVCIPVLGIVVFFVTFAVGLPLMIWLDRK